MIIAIHKFFEESCEEGKIDPDSFLQHFVKPLLPESGTGKNMFGQPKKSVASSLNKNSISSYR